MHNTLRSGGRPRPKDESSVSLEPRSHLTSSVELQTVQTGGLDRFIGVIAIVAFSTNLQASWESVAVSFQAGLLNGGPTALVYGSVVAFLGTLALACSLAELASIHPTVGAQYHWASQYAPRVGSPRFWGLLQGWLTVFAWIATCAQPAFLVGTLIQGLIVLNKDNYRYERWHGTLLAWAVFAVPFFVNIFARKTLRPLETFGGCTHILFLIIWVVVLTTMAPHSDSEFVFKTTVTDLSGWTNPGASWCIGLLSAVFPVGGFDGVIHMSDEVKDPHKNIPRAMIYSVLINGTTAICFMITILYCLGDPELALTSPTGYPIIQVIYGATGSKSAATIMVFMIVFNGMVALFSSLASVTRLFWQFARDDGLPFSSIFKQTNTVLRIPFNALLAVATIILLLQIINIGSTTALFAILSLSTIGLYLSYLLPISFFLIAKIQDHRHRHRHTNHHDLSSNHTNINNHKKIEYGIFHLPYHLGLFINFFALIYGVFVVIWLPFPPYLPVTRENFNYAGPIILVVVGMACLDYFVFGGRRRFGIGCRG